MKRLILCAALLSACASAPPAAESPAITEADTSLILGSGWTGELVYRDYSPPYGHVTLRTEMDVRRVDDGLELDLRYLDEPSANGPSILEISDDGRAIDGHPVITREPALGQIIVVTRGDCTDDDRPAICTHTYSFSERNFASRKTVDFGDGSEAMFRNEYVFNRP